MAAEQAQAEFNLLIKKRGSVKAKLTHFKNYVDKIVALDSLSDIQLLEIERKIKNADSLSQEFAEIQCQIECLAEDAEPHYRERESFDNTLDEYIAIAKNLGNKESDSQSVRSNSARSDSGNNDNNGNTNVNSLRGIKLPTIQLQKFSGKFEDWFEFRDTYHSLIHTNNTITDMQKYHYLRASLEGEAAKLLRAVEFSEANYSNAYQTLLDTFDNSNILIRNHVKALFSVNQIKYGTSQEIRQTVTNVSHHLKCLSQLGEATAQWDTLIIHMVATKLDLESQKEWEKFLCDFRKKSLINVSDRSRLNARVSPKFEHFKEFLKDRADFLETIQTKGNERVTDRNNSKCTSNRGKSFISWNTKCAVCNKEHAIQNCAEFNNLTINDRIDRVKKLRLCLNCLKGGHFNKYCRLGPCKRCRSKHNTMLHLEKSMSVNTEDNSQESITEEITNEVDNTSLTMSSFNNVKKGYVLLSTALIQILDNQNKWHTARAILDSGSQSSYVTSEFCDRLKLKRTQIDYEVLGINNVLSRIKSRCDVKIQSIHNAYEKDITCFVLPDITGEVPNIKIDKQNLDIPKNIRLADPEFHKPGRIDVLLGADLFFDLLCIGQIKLGINKPILQKTVFGWIISGPVAKQSRSQTFCNISLQNSHEIDRQILDQMSRFWEIEGCDNNKLLMGEAKLCEDHFIETTIRDSSGRFIVSIPFKDNLEKLGDSRIQAERRFLALERKLHANLNLKHLYQAFIREYEALGHMSKIAETKDVSSEKTIFYMPHHGVLRQNSLTSKLRVVFDCSAPTTTGFSLNNLQMVGPTVQDDLLSIILRFRKYRYVISADIEKMYRQVLVEQRQRSLQRIVWRNDPAEPLQTYELNTVTYGMAASAYLATRCVQQVALDCSESFPQVSRIIEHDFYVDDLLTGSDNLNDAINICKTVSEILKRAGFELRKFQSNEPKVIESVNVIESENCIKLGSSENCKTLGISWCVRSDELTYKITPDTENMRVTKRIVLSHISQIFDPLGLLSPSTIIAKAILQKLWLAKLSWDEAVPADIHTSWLKLKDELLLLNTLKIPRHVVSEDSVKIELHGYSDASETAYGGCLYVRSINYKGDIFVYLLCAKSKVAPIKSLTIPRLELCGAVVLSKLIDKAIKSLNITFDNVVLWTDSTVLLGWLKTSSNNLKPFVGNRVSEIQTITANYHWKHVGTKENPADILSRGAFPNTLRDMHMWWCGPEYLHKNETEWPVSSYNFRSDNLPDMRTKVQSLSAVVPDEKFPFNRFSNLQKLKRVTAYMFRFKYNCLNKESRTVGPLTFQETHYAFICLIKSLQSYFFSGELKALENGKPISHKSPISKLSPFLDDQNLLRVGGRLGNSDFAYDKRFPILVHAKHHLSKLIFENEHLKLYHAGPQLLLASVREKFWAIGGRNLAKYVVKGCVKCFRYNATTTNPPMGNLPKLRFNNNFPFQTSGVDYAGPFYIRDRRGRGAKMSKCYLSLFVCFATKALHLELVSDLTTQSFILAFRRFVSRRGKPSHVFSDNGKNFVGARSELRELGQYLQRNGSELSQFYEREDVQWHFIPAQSPHFGGLWEAGVKTVKYHLKRTMGNASLTFEEFYSLLVQIEAIVNSRPLCPLSTDPNDLQPLTPAHLLIGRSLVDIPDPDVTHLKECRLSQFQRIQAIKQHYWKRWSKEYVGELQQKQKWIKNGQQLQLGALVLVKEDNLPPMKWKLGRVVAVHPGSDNITRVATVKTSVGEVKRSFAKLCPLPSAL